ncbi:MAG: response regulator transcription factor [Nocardioidaceae bacterium]|nr:response regulator transcription factor [Nocardioidaceae bacterium]
MSTPASAPIRVLLVDDDALVRAGLALILGGADDVEVVGEAADGQLAVDALTTGGVEVDLVLMDIRMPNLDGLGATERIQQMDPPPLVIVLTTFDADDYVVRALAAGASGFLLKDTPPARIVEAVRKVAAGEPMLSPSVTESLIRRVTENGSDRRRDESRRRVDRLTERELEVAVAVGRGLSNAEISKEMFLSLATVKAHVSHIFTKLDVRNRTQIAICVHDAGLV